MDNIARTQKQLGSIVRRYRKHKGMSQGTLGSKSSLRQATISSIENGESDASLTTMMDILAALDLELVVRPRSKGSDTKIEDIF
ncbi:helix-turn-helix domain-containing protein [Yoonia sp. GPGPB17]|uniref:helix-turn-helix transcriptional regulator n=1 Tax=Yoonia sp. GPGPB17 TaxID=3026147 RepID=UPI0030C33EDC